MPTRLAERLIQELVALDAAGWAAVRIAARVGCAATMVCKARSLYPRGPRERGRGRLSLEEREEISRGLQRRESQRSISRRLGRAPSTISREVKAQASSYRAWRGERRAYALASRPKRRKMEE